MFSGSSLAQRFWLVLLLVFAPMLTLILHDYAAERQGKRRSEAVWQIASQ